MHVLRTKEAQKSCQFRARRLRERLSKFGNISWKFPIKYFSFKRKYFLLKPWPISLFYIYLTSSQDKGTILQPLTRIASFLQTLEISQNFSLTCKNCVSIFRCSQAKTTIDSLSWAFQESIPGFTRSRSIQKSIHPSCSGLVFFYKSFLSIHALLTVFVCLYDLRMLFRTGTTCYMWALGLKSHDAIVRA